VRLVAPLAERSSNLLPSGTLSKGLLHWRVLRLVKRRIWTRSTRTYSMVFSHPKRGGPVAVVGMRSRFLEGASRSLDG
jgi:hypothetical protein